MGRGLARYRLSARDRGDLRDPWRGGGVRQQSHANSAEPGRPHQGKQRLQSLGAIHLLLRVLRRGQPPHVEIRRRPGGHLRVHGRRASRLRPVSRQRQLQFMPPRRRVSTLLDEGQTDTGTPAPAPQDAPGTLSIIRPRRIPPGLRPIRSASAIAIWDWALFFEAGSAPPPIRTPTGWSWHRASTARCRC
jgi:hypothetical protein